MRLATEQLVDTVEVTLSQSFDKECPTRHDFQDNIKSPNGRKSKPFYWQGAYHVTGIVTRTKVE